MTLYRVVHLSESGARQVITERIKFEDEHDIAIGESADFGLEVNGFFKPRLSLEVDKSPLASYIVEPMLAGDMQ